MGGFSDFWYGKKPKFKQKSSKSPEQMEVLKNLLQGGGLEDNPLYQQASQFLQQLMSGDTEAFEAPLKRQFEEQIAPGIAERYAGLGATSSSGINQSLSQAGADLSERLGAQRAGLMKDTLPQALAYSKAPFEQIKQLLDISPYSSENFIKEGTQGAGEDIIKLLMMLAI